MQHNHNALILLLDASFSKLYTTCSSQPKDIYTFHPVDGLQSVTIKGYNGKPIIGCHSYSDDNTLVYFNHVNHTKFQLVFENIHVQNAMVHFNNTEVRIIHSIFVNSSLRALNDCKAMSLYLHRSKFVRERLCMDEEDCYRIVDSYIFCQNLDVDISNCLFQDAYMLLTAMYHFHINVESSIFTKELKAETGTCGINITLPYDDGRLLVQNCTFSNIVHYDPIYSGINIEAGALRVESWGPPEMSPINAVIEIVNCSFRHNERALSISHNFASINITDTVFQHNVAIHAAAAIRLAVSYTAPAYITNCSFLDNAAGQSRQKGITGRFEIENDQLRITSKLINGIISLVGKGGAVRIQKGNVLFHTCVFNNNTARMLGGAIFNDRGSTVNFTKTIFQNTPDHIHSVQGDIIYSSGFLNIISAEFIITAARDHISVLRHSGHHWSMNVLHMTFHCPLGHRLLMVNTTSHRIQNNGLMKSHKLDQLYYYCQTCGNNQYSLDQGSVNYTVTDDTTEYMTLMIDGNKPFQTHSVNFMYENITCRDCPYGGDCERAMTAVANFWGYTHGALVSFQHCPPDYCCHSTKCPTIDACAANRIGRLCGRCMEGYSEATFSPTCISNHLCSGNKWIYPFTVSMGLIYGFFLVFQKEIRDFIFVGGEGWKKYLLCCFVEPARRASHSLRRRSQQLRWRKSQNSKRSIDAKDTEKLNEEYEMKLVTANDAVTDNIQEIPENKREPGFIIILFYYFQDALLLHIDTVYTKTISKFQKRLKEILIGLFRFQFDIFTFFDDICMFPGLTPVTKTLFKTLFVPYVLLLFGAFYCFYRWCLTVSTSRSWFKKYGEKLSPKLSSGFILAMLFTYQKLATTTFTLLNCVPVGNETVLFIDGTQTCFQTWQYAVMAYAFGCILPFSVILMLGPVLLNNKYITLSEFFCGCLVPFPAVTVWLIRYCRNKTHDIKLTVSAQTVRDILQGPFKEPKSKKLFSQLCWAGVLIGRRLILFLCFTFINDVLLRLLCMLCVCFVMLMQHMYVRPYRTPSGNLAGAFSAAALMVVGAINLLRASFEAAEYVPQGPNRLLMLFCEEIENFLVLWLPMVGMSLILIVLVVKFILLFMELMIKRLVPRTNKTPRDENGESVALNSERAVLDTDKTAI